MIKWKKVIKAIKAKKLDEVILVIHKNGAYLSPVGAEPHNEDMSPDAWDIYDSESIDLIKKYGRAESPIEVIDVLKAIGLKAEWE